MLRFRPSFSTLLVFCGLAILLLEIFWLGRARSAATHALANLEQKIQERDWLAHQQPAPVDAVEQALTSELAAGTHALADFRAAFRPRDTPEEAPAPQKSLEEFFSIAGFVEKARAQSLAARVALRPDERFGFASHANEGPAAALVPVVHRQCVAAAALVETLLEARPVALLAVRRERPGPPDNERNGGDDFFTLDPALSLRALGQVETTAFRLEFSGQTATLRNLLGTLAIYPRPVLVRSVDVEPLARSANLPTASPSGPVPLVRQTLSKFSVIVEFVVLAARSPGDPAP